MIGKYEYSIRIAFMSLVLCGLFYVAILEGTECFLLCHLVSFLKHHYRWNYPFNVRQDTGLPNSIDDFYGDIRMSKRNKIINVRLPEVFFFSDDPWYTTLNVLGVEKLRRIFFSPVGYAKLCLYCKGISVQRGAIYSPMVNFINFC